MKARLIYKHNERHYVSRTGWLRASVLGANDGIISVSSLVIGIASASASPSDILVAGVAGLVAGAMSMAAGEYVSVSSQYDLEQAGGVFLRTALCYKLSQYRDLAFLRRSSVFSFVEYEGA